MRNMKKRVLAAIIAAVVAFSAIPGRNVFADERSGASTTTVETFTRETIESEVAGSEEGSEGETEVATAQATEEEQLDEKESVAENMDLEKESIEAGLEANQDSEGETEDKESPISGGTISDSKEAEGDDSRSESDKEEKTDKILEAEKDEQAYPAFDEEAEQDDVKIRVTASEGVFPTNSILKVSAVDPDEEDIDLSRIELEEDINVAKQFLFDIKVLDQDGNEVQPNEGQIVNVTFESKLIGNENLDVNVFHDSGEEVEKLDVETSGDEAMVESKGFSIFMIAFTYKFNPVFVYKYEEGINSAIRADDLGYSIGINGFRWRSAEWVRNSPDGWSVERVGGQYGYDLLHFNCVGEGTLNLYVDGVDYYISVFVVDQNEEFSRTETYEAPFSSITFDANGGTFSEGRSTNVIKKSKKIISRTNDFDNDGKYNGSTSNPKKVKDSITIEGATELNVNYKFYGPNSGNIEDGWLCIYGKDVDPAIDNYSESISGRISGNYTNSSAPTVVSGDTVQLFCYSNDDRVGYYAEISAVDQGNYEEPMPGNENSWFYGWNTKADGTGQTINNINNYSPTNNITLYAMYRDETISEQENTYSLYKITYNANGGAFRDGTDIHNIHRPETKIISRSGDYDDSGEYIRSFTDPNKIIDKITVDGADKIIVSIKSTRYETNDSWLCIWEGDNALTIDNYEDYIIPCHGYYKEYTYEGDNITIFSHQHVQPNDYDPGYYAIIDAKCNDDNEYEEPILEDYKFVGWNTKVDGTGETIDPGTYFPVENVTLYAQYQESKKAILFEDGSLIFVDTDKSLDSYISEHGAVVKRYVGYENSPSAKMWEEEKDQIKKIIFDTEVKVLPRSEFEPLLWFNGLENLESIENAGLLDVSDMTRLNSTFYNCKSLKFLDISGWDVGNVTAMTNMFSNCESLEELDINTWNTSNVKQMEAMFSNSGIEILDLSKWDTSSLSAANAIFSDCKKLRELNISNWNCTSLYDIYQIFDPLSDDCCNLNNLIARNVTLNPYITSISNLFNNLSIDRIDVSYWNWNSYNLTDISCAFNNNSTREINVTGWDTSRVTNMSNAFLGNTKLTKIIGLENWDVSHATDMSGMFSADQSLKSLNLMNWNTGNVNDMSYMFYENRQLSSLSIGTWNTGNVSNMKGMFENCNHLYSLDLSGWNTSIVTTMDNMFTGCEHLEEIHLGNTFEFIGDADYLPCPHWINVTNEEVGQVERLWNNYDGSTMAGTYWRCEKLTELTLDTVDGIDFDKEKGEITVYVDSDAYWTPVSIRVPAVGENLILDPELAALNEELAEVLADALVNGTYEELDLKVTVKARTYGDVMACVHEDRKVLWTFDIPKDNTSVIKMELFTNSDNRKDPPYDTQYLGYIMNSEEDLETFILYDADGNELESLTPGFRHTYEDLGYEADPDTGYVLGEWQHEWDVSRPKLTDIIYPEYQYYISGNPSMNNYEVPIFPGRYEILTSSVSSTMIPLTAEKFAGKENDEGEFEVTSYGFSTDGESEYSSMTAFNQIKQDAYMPYAGEHNTFGSLRKTDRDGNPVMGAIYRFTNGSTTVYGITDKYGLIQETDLYKNINLETGQVSENVPYTDLGLHKVYIAKEIKAPDGFYINPDIISVMFWIDHMDEQYGLMQVGTYCDAVSINSDDGIKPKEGQNDPNIHYCYTCMHGELEWCMCHKFGVCGCDNCGVFWGGPAIYSKYFKHTDVEWPTVRLQKLDEKSNNLLGARLQLIDKTTNTVLDDWVSDGNVREYQFNSGDNAAIGINEERTLVMHEVSPPDETYSLAEDIEFVVAWNSGSVIKTMVDYNKYPVEVEKINEDNELISGAHLQILDNEGTVMEEWDTDGTLHRTAKILKVGQYTLHESSAPATYLLAEDITFNVGQGGVITIDGQTVDGIKITMIDKKLLNLPVTGGAGTKTIGMISIVLMSVTAMAIYHKRRKAVM